MNHFRDRSDVDETWVDFFRHEEGMMVVLSCTD